MVSADVAFGVRFQAPNPQCNLPSGALPKPGWLERDGYSDTTRITCYNHPALLWQMSKVPELTPGRGFRGNGFFWREQFLCGKGGVGGLSSTCSCAPWEARKPSDGARVVLGRMHGCSERCPSICLVGFRFLLSLPSRPLGA